MTSNNKEENQYMRSGAFAFQSYSRIWSVPWLLVVLYSLSILYLRTDRFGPLFFQNLLLIVEPCVIYFILALTRVKYEFITTKYQKSASSFIKLILLQ